MKIETWAAGLWGYVDEHFEVGRPLYLSVDGLELQKIARQLRVDFENPSAAEADFLLSCLTRISVSSGRAEIDQSVFDPSENGRSLAICFAAQQILAAERMIGNAEASSDAYYARYRQVLGLNPVSIGSPLAYHQFQQIWDVLRGEILSLPGARASTITFQNGRGKNKYRALPMSQALLDQETLSEIHDRVSDIQNRSDDNLLHRIRRISGHLSKRSREKVYVEAIRVGLLTQVRSFIPEEVDRLARGTSGEKEARVEAKAFYVYIEDDGWDDVYRLGLRSLGDQPEENIDLDRALRSYFQQHTLLAFEEGSVSDFEGMAGSNAALYDAGLVVVPETLPKSQADQLAEYFNEPESSAVPIGYRMLLRDKSVSRAADVSSEKFVEEGDRLSLVGGIVVDRLRQTYLTGFPPSQVKVGEATLDQTEEIMVNGEVVTVGRFLRRLGETIGTEDFRISFENQTLYLGLAPSRDGDCKDFGYPIREGFCSTRSEEVGEGAVRYFQLSEAITFSAALERRFNRGELLKHLSVSSDSWIPVDNEVAEIIASIVERGVIYSRHNEFLLSEMLRRCEFPVALVKALADARRDVV